MNILYGMERANYYLGDTKVLVGVAGWAVCDIVSFDVMVPSVEMH